MMAGTFKPYNSNNSDSNRISEELFDAFNLDEDYEDREGRKSRSSNSYSTGGRRRTSVGKRRNRRKDRQLLVMVGMCVLGFLLIAEILCGIFIWKLPALPMISIFILNLAISIVLDTSFVVAPILIAVVEIAAGVFVGQLLLVVLGVILLATAQVFCYLLK